MVTDLLLIRCLRLYVNSRRHGSNRATSLSQRSLYSDTSLIQAGLILDTEVSRLTRLRYML